MLLVGALALAVPIIAWQSVKQLDASLKQARIDVQTLKVANARIALAEAEDLQQLLDEQAAEATDNDLFAESARYPLFVDGYDDDWRMLTAESIPYGTLEHYSGARQSENDGFTVRAAQHQQHVFLFLDITDSSVVFHQPPRLVFDAGENERPDENQLLTNGDSVDLILQRPDEAPVHYLFKAIAPGIVTPVLGSDIHRLDADAMRKTPKHLKSKTKGGALHHVNAYWVTTAKGAQIEIRFPALPLGSNIAIAYRDIDTSGDAPVAVYGDFNPDQLRGYNWQQSLIQYRPLYRVAQVAESRLAPWVTAGMRARLYDRRGRLVADVNALYEQNSDDDQLDPASGSLLNAILFRLFSYFVSDDAIAQTSTAADINGFYLDRDTMRQLASNEPLTSLYDTQDNDRVLGTALAIGGETPNGYLLFESNEDPRAAYTSSRLARLFSLLTLISVLTGCVLFAYATILSLRIRKLSQQANLAVSEEGRVVGLSESTARDEIGDLSRNLSSLLTRSANYTQYLEALSSRLSHELRTPLSVVKTSIENLDRAQLDQQSLTLIDRANSGADQLGSIIKALVESTRLEQTVQQAEMELFDLPAWLEAQQQRYQQIYPKNDVSIDSDLRVSGTYYGSPELLEQALDNLVGNAVSFSTDQHIRIILAREPGTASMILAVANTGQAIDQSRLKQLFDPMVSERAHDGDELHLGLGLYIVRMIAEAHGGIAFANNQPSEVWFGMKLPLQTKLDHF